MKKLFRRLGRFLSKIWDKIKVLVAIALVIAVVVFLTYAAIIWAGGQVTLPLAIAKGLAVFGLETAKLGALGWVSLALAAAALGGLMLGTTFRTELQKATDGIKYVISAAGEVVGSVISSAVGVVKGSGLLLPLLGVGAAFLFLKRGGVGRAATATTYVVPRMA